MTIRIRKATTADVEIVGTFNSQLAQESENKILDPVIVRRGVAALLADPAKGRYFLAEIDGEVVGQLMITYEYSDWRAGWFWWVQSVYVQEKARRQGVFRRLFEEIRQQAILSQEVIGVRLYVEVENERAQATYHTLGFESTNYVVFEKYPL